MVTNEKKNNMAASASNRMAAEGVGMVAVDLIVERVAMVRVEMVGTLIRPITELIWQQLLQPKEQYHKEAMLWRQRCRSRDQSLQQVQNNLSSQS